MSQFLLGPNGRLILAGGKPLAVVPGIASQTTTTAITLTPNYLGFTGAKFNVQTTAASGDTTADVPFVFTYTGDTPSSVFARVVDATGADVIGWTDISTSIQPNAGGTGLLGYLSGVPVGARYKRQIRVGASGTITSADTAPFSVGPNALGHGQSNMVNTIEGGVGDGLTPNFGNVPGSVPLIDEGAYWRASAASFFGVYGFTSFGTGRADMANADPGSAACLAMVRNIGDRLKAKYGRETGFCLAPWGVNGTGLAHFFTPGDSANAIMANSGTSGSAIGWSSPPNIVRGDYQVVGIHQGESENPAITRAQRKADLKVECQMHIDHVAKFGRPANKLTFLFAIMGVVGTSTNQFQMEVLRGAVLDLIADPDVIAAGWDVRIGWNCIDLDPANVGDNLHFGGLDRRRSNRRLTQAFMHALDPVGVPFGARGPMLTGTRVTVDAANSVYVLTGNATRSGDDITLTVTHEGGTALAAKTPGSPITGWYANTAPDFSGTDIALTNVTILPPNQIRVTATGAPATFYIKHCGNKLYTLHSYYPDVSNLIGDNFVHPTGADPSEQEAYLPLLPTPDAIKVGP